MTSEQKIHPAVLNAPQGFFGLGIAPGLLACIEQMRFAAPTPIQASAIPPALEGKDLIGVAQTGTGKTLAFAVPMLQRLAQGPGMGLVLVPTRELALQVEETFRRFRHAAKMESTVLIGGASMHLQRDALKRRPRIIVATPGRLLDHLEQRTVSLREVRVLVLDEADRMLDMGFAPQIERILTAVPKERQTMLFSATMPETIVQMASQHMRLPVRTEIVPSGTAAEKVAQELYIVEKEHKKALLEKLLERHTGTVLVFTRTKRGAGRTARAICAMGHRAAEIHSDRSLGQRREALEGFKSGRYRVLVATDIASRGIDVKGIELVINYDLPDETGNYVHRIGRTGRAGHAGLAISLATPEQGADVRLIEKMIRSSIPVSRHPDIPEKKFVPAAPFSGRRSFTYRGQRPRWR
jgi:ATP-dependent RNA helicase RhlE